MKNTFRRAAVIALATVMSGSVLPAGSAFAAGGSGSAPALVSYDVDGDGTIHSAEQAYRIETADHLVWYSEHHNDNYCAHDNYFSGNAYLANDIDLSCRSGNEPFHPIGDGTLNETGDIVHYGYGSTFDGNGKEIRGLNIDARDECAGLFGGITPQGVVRNLTVRGSVTGGRVAGGIAGASNGKIINCTSYVNVTARPPVNSTGEAYVGGIVGIIGNTSGFLEHCQNYGTVKCVDNHRNVKAYTGGITGGMSQIRDFIISDCMNYGRVESFAAVGGICGGATTRTLISCCGNEGEIVGTEYTSGQSVLEDHGVGGICGSCFIAAMENCYNAGDVTGTGTARYVGGLMPRIPDEATDIIRYQLTSVIKNCYNIGTVSGLPDQDQTWIDPIGYTDRNNNSSIYVEKTYYCCNKYGPNGCEVLSLTDMRDKNKFVGWDFSTIWQMGGYRPLLRASHQADSWDITAVTQLNGLPVSRGDYFIRSKANNRYLDLAASSYTNLICHDFNAARNQTFFYRDGKMKSEHNGKYVTMGESYNGGFKAVADEDSSVVAVYKAYDTENYYLTKTFYNRNGSRKTYALEVKNPSASNSVVFWNELQVNNVNQQWSVESAISSARVGSNFNIQNANSGLLLDMYTVNGTVLQHAANGGDNQKWQVISAGNGRYLLKTMCAAHPGFIGIGNDNRAVVGSNEVPVEVFDNRDGTFRIYLPGTNKFLHVANDSMGNAYVKWEPYTGTGGFHWKIR